jgi:hypothetical protein
VPSRAKRYRANRVSADLLPMLFVFASDSAMPVGEWRQRGFPE